MSPTKLCVKHSVSCVSLHVVGGLKGHMEVELIPCHIGFIDKVYIFHNKLSDPSIQIHL